MLAAAGWLTPMPLAPEAPSVSLSHPRRGSWGRGGELRLLQGRREGWVQSWGAVL